jgi:hypothetical protein
MLWLLPSSTSFNTCDTIAGLGPALRRIGLEMGEFLMLVFALALAALCFLAFFAKSVLLFNCTVGGISRSISTGELLEWVLWS